MALLWRRTTLVVALASLAEVSVQDYNSIGYNLKPLLDNQDFPNSLSSYDGSFSEEYIRRVHSMMDAHRGGAGDAGGGGGAAGARVVIETNALALVDTKYRARAWKRNGDMINSLLGLPKGMNDAGR